MNLLIDYLTFSVKATTRKEFNADFIFKFLSLDRSDFYDVGARMHYLHCYSSSQGINVYESSAARIDDMGCCVSMSGHGCRYFESLQKDGEMVDNSSIWREFFRKLRALNFDGYIVNVSRIDIAVDDISRDDRHFLDLDLIRDCAYSREFVSQFRHMYDFSSRNILTGHGTGQSLYFGSRKSATMCRFYDKLEEQRQKYINDPDRLKELEGITHWVRMEFEFKREQAIKIVNAICDSTDFAFFFAKVVNNYVRFVDLDNENMSRCTLKSWWLRFIGTCEKASLAVGDFKAYGYDKMFSYYKKYLATTVFTLLSRLSPEEFFTQTYSSAESRLKAKHIKIMGGEERRDEFTMSGWWDYLNPALRYE